MTHRNAAIPGSLRSAPGARTAVLRALAPLLVGSGLLLAGCWDETAAPDAAPLQNARESIGKGDTATAMAELKKAVLANAQNPESRYLLGDLYLKTGNSRGAVKELQRARQLGHPEAALLPKLAQAWLDMGDHRSVIAGVPSGTVSPELLILRANALILDGRLQEAERTFQRADVGETAVRGQAGLVRTALLHLDGALAERRLAAALERFPGDPELQYLKGEVELLLGRYEDAEATFGTLLARAPGKAGLVLGLARARIGAGRIEEAGRLLASLDAGAAGYWGSRLIQAVIDLHRGDWPAVRWHAEAVLLAEPDVVPALYLAGIAALARQQHDTAHRFFLRYLAAAGDDPTVRRLMEGSAAAMTATDTAGTVASLLAEGRTDARFLRAVLRTAPWEIPVQVRAGARRADRHVAGH